jgi:hypothetical protein
MTAADLRTAVKEDARAIRDIASRRTIDRKDEEDLRAIAAALDDVALALLTLAIQERTTRR